MSVIKQAKMTTKTRKTIEIVSQLVNVEAVHLRKDRQAVDEMVRLLENEGYEWIPAKQEWAKVSAPLAVEHMKHFVVTCEQAHADTLIALLEAGADAYGVKVRVEHRIDNTDADGTVSNLLMEMTE